MTSRIGRIGAALVSVLAILALAGQANADVGASSGLSLATNGLTVYASGSWSWPDPTTSRDMKYVGYAMDWGDLATGNTLGSHHLGDGTAATNTVTPTPDRGSHGTFGPASHTYAVAGTYTVCAIIYDLGSAQPFRTTGWHSLRASGPSRNTDNSVDQQSAPPVSCATITVSAVSQATPSPSGSPTVSPTLSPGGSATPAPEQSVAGATFVPGGSTPPPTVTQSNLAVESGAGFALLLALLLSSLGAFVVLSAKRDRR